jgi:hypothetical protein
VLSLPAVGQGPSLHDAVITVICRLSLYVVLIPVNKIGLSQVVMASLLMRHVFCVFGLPTCLLTDKDHLFTGQWWSILTTFLPIRHITTSVYRAQGNGAVENANRRVITTLRALRSARPGTWLAHLPLAQWTLNSTPVAHLGCSPNEVVFGRHLTHLDDCLRPPHGDSTAASPATWVAQREETIRSLRVKLELHNQREADRANHKARISPVIAPGSLVWVYNHPVRVHGHTLDAKLAPLAHGPLRVAEFRPPGTYLIQYGDDPEPRSVHVDRVKPYLFPVNTEPLPVMAVPPPPYVPTQRA